MLLAVVGLGFAAWRFVQKKSFSIRKEMLWQFAIAACVSLASLVSTSINHTGDTVFVTYLLSFSVWLSAAFAVCCCIKGIHGRIDVKLALSYLAGASVFQCIIAIIIDSNPSFANWANSVFALGDIFEINRLYGLGAALDVAGAKFATVLLGLGFILSEITRPLKKIERIIYIIAFLLISVIGNMIARTTTVGMVIGLLLIIYGVFFNKRIDAFSKRNSAISWISMILLAIIISVTLYNTNNDARRLLRYGFEGFFSLAETGKWETTSTNILKSLVVFPETIHTWLIGDGYFENFFGDVNYLGNSPKKGFYMGTDIGYLRFIFYFGIMGLIPMIGVVGHSAVICMRRFKQERFLFALELLLGLIIWVKVSSDIVPFFAMFLSTAALTDEPNANA